MTELKRTYASIFEACYRKMTERSHYGNKDILASVKELTTQDIGSIIKAKAVRLKHAGSRDVVEDNAVDIINYAVEVLRRLSNDGGG